MHVATTAWRSGTVLTVPFLIGNSGSCSLSIDIISAANVFSIRLALVLVLFLVGSTGFDGLLDA